MGEWQVADNAWIKVSADPEPAGRTTVVIGVTGIDVRRLVCEAAGVPWGEVNDSGFIKTAEATDPAGNIIMFVQDAPKSVGDGNT